MWVTYILFIIAIGHCTLGSGVAKQWQVFENAKSSLMNKVVVDILRRCFESESTDTIGFIGKSNLLVTANTTFSTSIATILIEDPETVWKGGDDRSLTFAHGLPVFVISSSEGYSLERLLQGLKKTRWWNHEAYFITLDKNTLTEKSSCAENARELLMTTWKMDILTSIFLCANYTYDKKAAHSVFAYTYNPYKETAPIPWTKVETRAGPDGHPWTLFEQPYSSDKTTCDGIKLSNKTFDLNGFSISAQLRPYPPLLTLQEDWKSVDDFHGTDAHILKAVLKKLNVSLSLKTFDHKETFGDSYENVAAEGMIVDLLNGECDITLNLRYIRSQWGVRFTVAQATGGLSIVTVHRGWKSPLTKIADFVKFELILVVFIVCFVVVLMISYSPFGFVFPDLMNVLRLFLSTTSSLVPRTMPQRLLHFATMLMVFVFTSVLQGNLSGLLTSHIPRQQVETIHDIGRLGYDIYGYPYLAEFIPIHLLHRFHDTKLYHYGSCFDLLENNTNVACIAQKAEVWALRAKRNLHISEKRLATFHKAHTTRMDWPLYGRFNRLTERLIESGLTTYFKYNQEPNLRRRNKKLSAEPGRVLTTNDLRFAFTMLAGGLAVSGAALIIELFAAYLRLHRKNN